MKMYRCQACGQMKPDMTMNDMENHLKNDHLGIFYDDYNFDLVEIPINFIEEIKLWGK